MLVISRRPNETVVVGGSIRVTVTKIVGNKVWLGFDAPREVVVNREEIQQLVDAKAANPRKRRE
jgi:carbon storage regulator